LSTENGTMISRTPYFDQRLVVALLLPRPYLLDEYFQTKKHTNATY